MISTKTLEQADLVARIANHGIRNYVWVPRDPQECEDLKRRFESYMEDRYQRIRMLIAERTGDPELQENIFTAVNDLINRST